jgi:hypothetical protein
MSGLWQELHRVVWRRIPRTLRRRLLLNYGSIGAAAV